MLPRLPMTTNDGRSPNDSEANDSEANDSEANDHQ